MTRDDLVRLTVDTTLRLYETHLEVTGRSAQGTGTAYGMGCVSTGLLNACREEAQSLIASLWRDLSTNEPRHD